jgi:hypothetical protein
LGYTLPCEDPRDEPDEEYDSDEEPAKKKARTGRATATKRKKKKQQEDSMSEEESSEEEEGEQETPEERLVRKKQEYIEGFRKKNQPKGAPTAYIMYMTYVRPATAAKYPELTTQEVMKLIGPMWRALTKEEKAPWELQSLTKKKECKRLRDVFNAGPLETFLNGKLLDMMKATADVYSSDDSDSDDSDDSDDDDDDDSDSDSEEEEETRVMRKPMKAKSAYLYYSMAFRRKKKEDAVAAIKNGTAAPGSDIQVGRNLALSKEMKQGYSQMSDDDKAPYVVSSFLCPKLFLIFFPVLESCLKWYFD